MHCVTDRIESWSKIAVLRNVRCRKIVQSNLETGRVVISGAQSFNGMCQNGADVHDRLYTAPLARLTHRSKRQFDRFSRFCMPMPRYSITLHWSALSPQNAHTLGIWTKFTHSTHRPKAVSRSSQSFFHNTRWSPTDRRTDRMTTELDRLTCRLRYCNAA